MIFVILSLESFQFQHGPSVLLKPDKLQKRITNINKHPKINKVFENSYHQSHKSDS